jgi:integrase
MSIDPEYRGRLNNGRHSWRTRPYINGRRRSFTFHTPTDSRKSADRKKREIILRAEKAAVGVYEDGSVADLAADWFETKRRRLSPSTLPGYERQMKRIVERFGHVQVDELTGRDIDRWYGHLTDAGMSDAWVAHLHRVLRAILTFGYERRDYPAPATDKADPPTHTPAEVSPPTTAELRVLLEALKDLEWCRAVRVLAGSGLRRGEVVGLLWNDLQIHETMIGGQPVVMRSIVVRHSVLDASGGGVIVKSPKSGKVREAWLADDAVAALARQREYVAGIGQSKWIFPQWDHTERPGADPRHPSWLSLMWGKHRAMFVDDRLSRVRLHDLRHWHATQLIEDGIDMKTVSKQLGHADVTTTMKIYAHATVGSFERIGGAINRQLAPIDVETSGT